jgi:SAM-dependent methyltransferase
LYNNEDLEFVRERELELLVAYLAPGSRILELGAGTGYQARELSRRGFEVEAIDVASSTLRLSRVFPVIDYDGLNIPFSDASFDIVFSSNVLEHVLDLPKVLAETRRVLRPGGYAVHAMPSPAWRLWTTLAGPLDTLPFVASFMTGRSVGFNRAQTGSRLFQFAKGVVARFAPLPHGETGSALTELVSFGMRHWVRRFEENGFEVVAAKPLNLFYTGWFLLGRRWNTAARERAARQLGSACNVYQVRPLR